MLYEDKMTSIVKICKVHGNLTQEQITKSGKTKKGTIQLRCKECSNQSQKKHKLNNPDSLREWQKLYRQKNYDTKIRWHRLKNMFGIDKNIYEEMLSQQNSVCAICKQPESFKSKIGRNRSEFLCVDHCHDSGNIRGLLCRKCNAALGGFNDSIKMLETAINYLMKFT